MKWLASITLIAFFALVSFVSVGSISAQQQAVKANVPFDFTVGDKLLPAGQYTISLANANAIEIQNSDRHVAILALAAADADETKKAELVFNKYGDEYFLREIHCSQEAMNMTVPASRQEKRARAQQASLSHNGQQVYLALNR